MGPASEFLFEWFMFSFGAFLTQTASVHLFIHVSVCLSLRVRRFDCLLVCYLFLSLGDPVRST